MSSSHRSKSRSNDLKPQDLRKFHKSVRKVVLSLVHDQGVTCRMLDGTHLLLYPPDGKGRPFKVSASRPPKPTLIFLEKQFCADNNLEMP